MKTSSYAKVKLQFRQYSVNPDFPVFAFMKENTPLTPNMELNEGDEIRYMHFHNCIEIGYCKSGAGELYIEDQVYPYAQGDVMLVLPYSAHITRAHGADAYSEYLYLDPGALLRKFYTDDLPCLKLFESSSSGANGVIHGADNPVIARHIAEILEELRHKDTNYQDCVKGLALALLIELTRLIRTSGQGQPRNGSILSIFPALQYINENYTDRLHTESLHEMCFLSATHFRRLFSAAMGCSPLEYIHRLRINRACDLLLSTNDSILNISVAVGFDSVSSFNRQFVRATGAAPSRWRREHLKSHSELMPAAPYDVARSEKQ